MIITTITDIGDSLVISGIVMTGAAYLFFQECRKGAVALLLSFIGAAVLIGLAKLAFIGCSPRFQNPYNLHSPSGHSAMSASVIGTYALIIASQFTGFWRFVPVMIASPLIAAIAITRIVLKMHSVSEVVAGLIIGGSVLLGVHVFLRHGERLPEFNIRRFVLYTVLTAVILHGYRLPAEAFIHLIASYMSVYVPVCAA